MPREDEPFAGGAANLLPTLPQRPPARQGTEAPASTVPAGPAGAAFDLAGLLAELIDPATLARAEALAAGERVAVHAMLIKLGWVSEADYVRALAMRLGVGTAAGRRLNPLAAAQEAGGDAALLAVRERGAPRLVVVAASFAPPDLAALVAAERARGTTLLLATSAQAEDIRLTHTRAHLIEEAVLGLRRLDPDLSAATPAARWQVAALLLAAMATAGMFTLAPTAAVTVSLTLLAVPFLCVAFLRLIGLRQLLRADRGEAPQRIADEDLPLYSILVPLHDEAAVLPRLMRALTALDYPAHKLEILLVLEASDRATRTAADAMDLPGNARRVIVPSRGPRTKPKALNYALALARGRYVVVYDAEDRPEPDQLRRALARFREGEPELACVQACLNTYNPDASFLTRQFSLEYTVLFDAILPALERLRLPLPLGGTSNHFDAEKLRAAGAWDPYNVTEDADLGIRLARLGYRTATLRSTTWEEAPETAGNWYRQRTRWLKGWMQTYLVHMRRPVRLTQQLGLRATIGLQVLMGGILVAVLAHPLVYVLVAIETLNGRLLAAPQDALERWFWWGALGNLVLGLLSSMGVAAVATMRRGRGRLAPWVLAMPFYWLAISMAGYRALYQLAQRPFLWEKTQHGAPAARSGHNSRSA